MDLAGKRWEDVEGKLTREVLDVEVEVAFRRRQQRGSRPSETLVLRLVGIIDEKTGEHRIHLTNIPPDVLMEKRWRLCAGALGSGTRLQGTEEPVCSRRGQNEEAARRSRPGVDLHPDGRREPWALQSPPGVGHQELVPRYTPLRWSIVFVDAGHLPADGVLERIGFERTERGDLIRQTWFWERGTVDPHVKRHRLREGWYAQPNPHERLSNSWATRRGREINNDATRGRRMVPWTLAGNHQY